ncbi:hypothetical protein QQP08_007518 [Theobroma cacao]|nr:hypothetical protein QQP08_007518 [Theobroma cacao]
MEIDSDVEREKVEALVRELMEGVKGQGLRQRVIDWKKKSEVATSPEGSSYTNFDKLVRQLKQGMILTVSNSQPPPADSKRKP